MQDDLSFFIRPPELAARPVVYALDEDPSESVFSIVFQNRESSELSEAMAHHLLLEPICRKLKARTLFFAVMILTTPTGILFTCPSSPRSSTFKSRCTVPAS